MSAEHTSMLAGNSEFLLSESRTETTNIVDLALFREQKRVRAILESAAPELSEVRYLAASRTEMGQYADSALEDTYENGRTEAYEGAVPNGISRVVMQRHADGDYYWNGKNSIEVARSGSAFHKLRFALDRVDAEVAEAEDALVNLTPGIAKVTISPRATGHDASLPEAESEHLASEDMLRIQYLRVDPQTGEEQKVIETIRIFDMPLRAWTRFLQDRHNPFGQKIHLDNPRSALSVLRSNTQTYIDRDKLPEGAVTILRAAASYISAPDAKASVERQLERFEESQEIIREKVEATALERQKFVVELTDSLLAGSATPYVQAWLETHYSQLNRQAAALVESHQLQNAFMMSIELAQICSIMNKSILWGRLAILTGNESVLKDVPKPIQAMIIDEYERQRLQPIVDWLDHQQRQAITNYSLGNSNFKVGGGCPGEVAKLFENQDQGQSIKEMFKKIFTGSGEEKYDFDREAHCRVCDPKQKKDKVPCGPCNICKPCDTRLRKANKKPVFSLNTLALAA